nr:unnamed protein product [Callosobruchus analis]
MRVRRYFQQRWYTNSANPEYWVQSSCHQVAQESHLTHSEVLCTRDRQHYLQSR